MTGIAIGILFVRMLLSRKYREAIDKINNDMAVDHPWPGKSLKLSDKNWGLFGKEVGTPFLLWTRAVLFLGCFPGMLIMNIVGPMVFFLWFAAAMLSLLVSLMFAAMRNAEHYA
ncbi:MAG: hypothetical protein ABJL11_10940 [Parasphingorhabdus sp.]